MKYLHILLLLAALLIPFAQPTAAAQPAEISSLAGLSAISSSGNYLITDNIDASDLDASLASFSGTLEAAIDPETHMPFRIKNLSVPLFTTLTGTVKNLVVESVAITSGTNVGAIACTASGSARIYNVGILGGSVGGSNDVGGLVGFLDGTARVVNCYSFADITSGDSVGGIVGYNKVATASNNLGTMVFACMFYGNINTDNCPHRAPIYNGTSILNKDANGVSNFNYFRLEAPYVQPTGVDYNCALGAEDRFLQRFEFYRHLLNSHRELAGWWATGTYSKSEMHKWVMPPDSIGSAHPYPILMQVVKYPSVVNFDAANAQENQPRNQGGKLGTLTVNIQMDNASDATVPFHHPEGAALTQTSLTLNITDKDPDHFNFNYYKVQLPYYNDVGTKNYNGNRVVTGWKIVGINDGTPGTFTPADQWGGYNFADRNCTNKDLYGTDGSNRVFSQGAYWDVPEGVTAITIQPYWAKAAYVSDAYPDVVYSQDMGTKYDVPNVGGGQKYTNGTSYSIAGESQRVFTSINDAVTNANGLNKPTSNTVNDYAVVLVGNVHQYNKTKDAAIGGSYKYTVTTIDLDHDNEPDYSLMLRNNGRNVIHPLKWDFLTISGIGMAQKPTGGNGSYNLGILIPRGWFESTSTALFRVTQFEYENSNRSATDALIVHGGVMEQWVSTNQKGTSNLIPYIHVGSNVWFKEFHTGCHQDKQVATLHSPISVTGGDYDEFYLTGLYRGDITSKTDNAECYINGGRFGIVCGAAMEGIAGDISWQIQNADIHEFYAGGLNAAKPVTGNLSTTIVGSYVDIFCGGPKFGDMSANKTVVTNATNCTFGTFFGAGYGGNSYSRYAPNNKSGIVNMSNPTWNGWVTSEYKRVYNQTYGGVSTQFSYQFLPMSDNTTNVARIFVDFVKFSLATTRNVSSTLTGCHITGNFYGGGSLGKVNGPVTSILNSCMVDGDVYGAGFSASLPTVEVDAVGFAVEPYYYEQLGTYRIGVKGSTTTYNWEHGDISVNHDTHVLYTPEDLNVLGTVSGKVTLTIGGTSEVGGSVYGGGESSAVSNDIDVTLQGQTHVAHDVYGGGKQGIVTGNIQVLLID